MCYNSNRVVPLNFEVGRISKVYIDIENVFDTAKTHSIIKKKSDHIERNKSSANEKIDRIFQGQKAKFRIFRDSLFSFFQGQIRKFRDGRHVCKDDFRSFLTLSSPGLFFFAPSIGLPM